MARSISPRRCSLTLRRTREAAPPPHSPPYEFLLTAPVFAQPVSSWPLDADAAAALDASKEDQGLLASGQAAVPAEMEWIHSHSHEGRLSLSPL